MAQPEPAWQEPPFIVAGSPLWACRSCGSVVDGRLTEAHQKWHRDEAQRVAVAQQQNALLGRFPTRRHV